MQGLGGVGSDSGPARDGRMPLVGYDPFGRNRHAMAAGRTIGDGYPVRRLGSAPFPPLSVRHRTARRMSSWSLNRSRTQPRAIAQASTFNQTGIREVRHRPRATPIAADGRLHQPPQSSTPSRWPASPA